MSSDSHRKKLAICLNQRRDSPKRDHNECQENSSDKLKASGRLPIPVADDYHTDGEQRCPGNWALGKKTEGEREIKNKEGRFPNRPRRSGDRRSLVGR